MNRLLPCLMILLATLVPSAMTLASGDDHDAGDKGRDAQHKHHDGRRDRDLSAQDIAEALRVIRRIDPESAAKYEKIQAENPDKLGPALVEAFPYIERFLAMRRYAPRMYELRIEDFRLSHATRQTARRLIEARENEDPQASALSRKLRDLVAEHFEIRQKLREQELERLQQRIERLREQLEQRTDDRQSLVDQRLKELTEDGEKTQW